MFGHTGVAPVYPLPGNFFTLYAGMGILERTLFTALREKDFKGYAHDYLHPIHEHFLTKMYQ